MAHAWIAAMIASRESDWRLGRCTQRPQTIACAVTFGLAQLGQRSARQ